ncbi:MAG TPA: SRPBCC domain-containing protein, partial [Solirubrobacterales bacterium]|nr:SRPBCC domain-containing protein [Solirubrobacterales bacterium]
MSENQERMVERERILDAEPERVWDALTDDYLLSDWFAKDARLEPVEGGEVAFGCEDGERSGTVQVVEEERELTFTWSRDGE